MWLTFARGKMYKSRFTQWGLRKNAKKNGKNHQQPGWEKRSSDRSSPLPAEGRGYLIPVMSTENPRTMMPFTPLFHPLTTPSMLAIPERMLHVIWDYFRGSFESGTWVLGDDEMQWCCSTKPVEYAQIHMGFLEDQCLLACRLINRRSFQDVGKILISATARIKDIILAEAPTTLSRLFQLFHEVCVIGRYDIIMIILRQFSAMAMTVLGDGHPICHISGLLNSVDQSHSNEVVAQCMSSICDSFRSLIGPMHYTAIVAHAHFLNLSREREGKLRNLLGKCESDLGLVDERTIYIQFLLAFECYENDDYMEARRLGQELFVRCQPSMAYHRYRAEGLFIIAMSQYALGERDSAESCILYAIALVSPLEQGRIVTFLCVLEDWLLEQGREDAAAKMWERQRKLQEFFESDPRNLKLRLDDASIYTVAAEINALPFDAEAR